MASKPIYKGKSTTYKGVYIQEYSKGKLKYWGHSHKRGRGFDTEREAAVFVDTVLIENNKLPVNILKPKA